MKNFSQKFIVRPLKMLGGYIVGVFKQGRRVRWPDAQTLVKSTGIVIVFGGFFAAYLGLCNALIVWMLKILEMNI